MKKTLIFICLLPLGVFAQVDRSKAPAPGPAPKIELGRYESFVLPNGLKVFVVENNELPRVAFNLVLDVDPVLEGEKAGYVDAAAALLQRGTASRSKQQIDEELDFIGAAVSVGPSGLYASSLKKHTPKLLEIVSDVLLNPSFPERELEKIKKEIISGLAAEKDDPGAISANLLKAVVYGKDYPYGEIATEESVAKITREDCKKYYETYMRPSVAYLAVVGDVTKTEAEKLVSQYFGKWQRAEVPKKVYKQPMPPNSTLVAVVDRPVSVQSVVDVAWPLELKHNNPDVMAVNVLDQILGGGATGRLFLNLREKKGYTYGAYSSLSPNELVALFSASASVRNEVTDSAVSEIIHEIKRITEEKVGAEDLQHAKNYLAGGFARALESPQTVATFAINTERYKLPSNYYTDYLKNLQAVTADDVYRVARTYLKPAQAYVTVVGHADEIAEKLRRFGPVEYFDLYGNRYTPEPKKNIPAGLTADVVMENYVKALGGRENLLKVKDVTIRSSADVQGMSLDISSVKKAPDKLYFSGKMQGAELLGQVYDGEKGVTINMGTKKELSKEKAEELRLGALMNPELEYKKYGIQKKLIGIEKINGKEAYKLEVLMPSGKKKYEYFDPQSGLKTAEVSSSEDTGKVTQQTVYFEEYREAEGVKYPYKITINGLVPFPLIMQVKSVEVNKGVKDDLFKINQ